MANPSSRSNIADPLRFPPLSEVERQTLLAVTHGPQRLHGYLFIGTDSKEALAEHYRDMPLHEVHRMHLELAQLLPKIGKDGLGHSINDCPWTLP